MTNPPDYARAERFESNRLIPLVKNLTPLARWIGTEDRFWLKKQTAEGAIFVVVDAATGRQEPAFDHERMAAALAGAGLTDCQASALPITDLAFTAAGLVVTTPTGRFRCAADLTRCDPDPAPPPTTTERPSPDGARVAFVRAGNIWIRDRATGRETQLTDDGRDGHAWGSPLFDLARVERRRAGQPAPLDAIHWSPDGRYLTAMRADLRNVPLRSAVTEHLPPDQTFVVAHPDYVVVAGDPKVPDRDVTIIDTATGSRVGAKVDPARLHDFAPLAFSWGNLWWTETELCLLTADHGGQTYGITAVDLATGAARTIVEESEPHYYAFAARDYHAPGFHVTRKGREAIFYSQRSGAGQLYLYDAVTGREKNSITGTAGVVFDLIRVDEAERVVYFTAGGREAGRNPYYIHLYRVSFDGGAATLLTPEDATHEFFRPALALFGPPPSHFSPSGRYFVDVYSTIAEPPRMVIRTREGAKVADVVEADISALTAIGWRPPERFVVKAADGVTDLYGAMFKPADFDPARKYAVVDQTYPGPQIDSGPQSFADGLAGIITFNAQATAETGLIVVTLDGRGTTRRDRAFRYAFAGTEDVFGSADHRAAIENLARRFPYLDATRVGITGASFGGYGSLRAALLHPDFFTVVVSHVGPHEYRYSVWSGISVERFFGVPGGPRDIFDKTSNIAIIERLQARLMLVYGEIDENVPLRAGIAIFDALMKADKDFVSYVVPNANHGLASRNPYIVARQRRFFRDHLGGPA